MWPLSRSPNPEYLRIGRLAAQRWVRRGTGLELVAAVTLPTHAISAPECLGQALSELYTDKPQGKVSLVLESAWMPVLLADTGGVLLSTAEAEALVRHRLHVHHGAPGDDLSGWDIRADHRAGHRFVLGYGLAGGVRQILLSAAEQAQLRLDTLTPAFTWGWQRLRPVATTGWWVWPEQDRMLLARWQAGRVVALNPAVPLADNSAAIQRLVQAEALRWGVPANAQGLSVASWHPPAQLPPQSPGLVWCSLVGAS